jgi:hypothetical protein
MKAKERSLGYWIVRRFRTTPAQSMVEFALALPVLLLATFGVVEFGRLMQAWLALENGARFAVRYAVTGEFNEAYCDEADAALGMTALDGNADCKVEPAVGASDADKQLARDRTQALQDWARLPSIRDSALAGASGIAYDESVSGNYLEYLRTAPSKGGTFSPDNRGDPSKPGFFFISICSSRYVEDKTGAITDKSKMHFYLDESGTAPHYLSAAHTGDDKYLFYPEVCKLYHPASMYIDDAGSPGNTVRIALTYRHNLIMPLLSDWWPTLRLNTARDGIVEKFRTSRVTGLSEGNLIPDTPTFTPSQTVTSTASLTPTETPLPCVTGGNGIRAEYYNYTSKSNPFTSPIVIRTEDWVNFNWANNSPAPGAVGVDKFSARFVAQIMPEYTEQYTFYAKSDDGQRLWVNGALLVDNWVDQSATEKSGVISLERCHKYDLVMEYYENAGSASSVLSWQSNSQVKQVIPKDRLFSDLGTLSTATATKTSTVTLTQTITKTFTITNTPTTTVSPTRTYTRTQTLIPSLTYTRTETLIPSKTYTRTTVPSKTVTNTATLTFTPVDTATETTIPNTKTHTPDVPTPTRTKAPTIVIGG